MKNKLKIVIVVIMGFAFGFLQEAQSREMMFTEPLPCWKKCFSHTGYSHLTCSWGSCHYVDDYEGKSGSESTCEWEGGET